MFAAGWAAGLIVLGSAFLVPAIRSARLRERLLRDGRRIEAEFLDVFPDTGLSFNGRRPFRVAVQANDPVSGALRRFNSVPIWVDPSERLRGRSVPVLLDETGKRYFVDLRGLVDEEAYA